MRPAILLGLVATACATTTPLPAGAPEALCRVDAVVSVLPSDPDQLTLGDLKDIVGRLKTCGGDAGPS